MTPSTTYPSKLQSPLISLRRDFRNNDISTKLIENKIYFVRGHKVMLDADLAELYGVPTKRLNEQIRRNKRRFPSDFMFQLSAQEAGNLWSQFATSRWGGRRYRPHAFTEQGVSMLSSVLNSQRAIDVNIAVMRTFVIVREIMSSNKELARKIEKLKAKFDKKFRIVFQHIKELITPPLKPTKKIGF